VIQLYTYVVVVSYAIVLVELVAHQVEALRNYFRCRKDGILGGVGVDSRRHIPSKACGEMVGGRPVLPTP